MLIIGDTVSAINNFNQCLELKPDNIDAILGLALIYFYKNDLDNAKPYIKKAKELNDNLKLGVEGFESFKKEGWFYSTKDETALTKMLGEFN